MSRWAVQSEGRPHFQETRWQAKTVFTIALDLKLLVQDKDSKRIAEKFKLVMVRNPEQIESIRSIWERM